MKRIPRPKLFVVLALAFLLQLRADTSFGAIQLNTGDLVRYDRRLDGTTEGGCFEFYHYASGQYFSTFCTEIEETVTLGADYMVSISSDTNSSGRTISDFGKWSFLQYVNGSLPGQGSLLANRVADGVQLGIWQDMGYVDTWGPIAGSQATWEQYRADRFGELPAQYLSGSDSHTPWLESYLNDQAWRDTQGAASVSIVQLWNNSDFTGGAQDILVNIVRDPVPTPEPGMLAVWSVLGGLAIGGSRLWRRGGARPGVSS